MRKYCWKRFEGTDVHVRMALKRNNLRQSPQYHEGFSAMKRGLSVLDNPYFPIIAAQRGTRNQEVYAKWDAWKLGWNEARVR